MNPLIKRQLRKYLSPSLQENEEVKSLVEAVSKSYNTSEEQFSMLQRATAISSEELYQANERLRKESKSQKEVIEKLKNVISTLNSYDLTEENDEISELDSSKLVDVIDNQTKEILQINKQRDRLLENLERRNKELNEYTHLVTHDLKSPLQSIDALTFWLRDDYKEALGEDGREKINLIRENVEKMDELVKGIAKYSTIGKLIKDTYEVDLNKIVNKVLKKVSIPQNIAVSIPEILPIVKGDNFRLEELFYSIIDNAVKFNDKEEGEIIINFTDTKDFWEFSIKDNGKGMEEQYFEKIFLAFQKLENDYKSAGIGLSIVKKIIEQYEGKIWIASELTKGTTFYFTLKK
ncbi:MULTISPECIES: sensor histidine kinase [unclassified Tenacibaculum]|uniref:sensor histidine kinase n=1 Tax=unclassified Tenacibaculum TaxID=2635139 RepID=UPI001F418C4F|nr:MULTISPECIES: ATP-binding protein [unclassified Tenacibaculum]MCF2875164.1 ATP-binding protein [Tenacibaculum sp. Cn5-1]MCF2935240.1 ATP-binding protein [Tenacibaculum sp. Cn5-34]MCG7511318.1 ATP-binding protein [Tenacibaculum sp. Cn5-46]